MMVESGQSSLDKLLYIYVIKGHIRQLSFVWKHITGKGLIRGPTLTLLKATSRFQVR